MLRIIFDIFDIIYDSTVDNVSVMSSWAYLLLASSPLAPKGNSSLDELVLEG